MARAFNARVQIPWQDFVEKYTYPKVFFDIKEENTEKNNWLLRGRRARRRI